ncbi:MAG: class I SAM-dependent methyltransferase [Bacillota bacterium]|uniref:Methyltransferase domain-containing protein n=1 Tax=Virgibacillus salarius TaxID=447199 RepID=A0A941IAF2_9BACI|nr:MULTISPECIES: class I SAM-dependent methyltransferase [Bacillaceae]NAZ08017.1 methyltransferase domain-containing protein [Agaribacter marinus]MBR7795302.1 methyltransferase domain-containing protein [Virgibacillus salarius]MCC2251923.1 methyltransferase domain-containing protein [Virgibacillus sp. AGTR]MDY7045621.1 class I SAM-dependent methyltransferase [Virgibacillus sp. M23]QRZ17378.1 methyltransferase domain-containing protein [Virgibacillus sp. AGTR]
MREKENVKKSFAKNKQAYITSATHARGSDLSLMKDWLELETSMKLLDIATGGGHVAKQLSPFVERVYATDLTKEMLENTKNYLQDIHNIDYILADAESLPFLNNTFDIITCRTAAHHFPHPEKFIQEVKRVLKTNGTFLFIDNIAPRQSVYANFINQLEGMRDFSHVRCLPIFEWKQLLDSYGLHTVKENVRKKELSYTEWINRTLDHPEDKQKVYHFIKEADEQIKAYYKIQLDQGSVQRFFIDEWFALIENK